MVSMSRPSQLALALALSLGMHGLAQGSFTFSSEVTPGSLSSSSGLSTLTFYTETGGSILSGPASMPIDLALITSVSSATTAESLGGSIIDTLTITDGGQTGTLTFTANVLATGLTGSGGGSFSVNGLNSPLASTVINGHEYTISNIGFAAPGTNSSIGSFTAFLSFSPSALISVPEPSSLVLMGLGGVALIAARRFKKSA